MSDIIKVTETEQTLLLEIPINQPLQKSIETVVKILMRNAVYKTVNKVTNAADEILLTDEDTIEYQIVGKTEEVKKSELNTQQDNPQINLDKN